MILGAGTINDQEAIKHSSSLKPLVLEAVMEHTGIVSTKFGLVIESTLPIFCASPAGVGDDCVLEVKCPLSHESMKDYVDDEDQPRAKVMAHIQLQMELLGKTKGFLCIADPSFKTTKRVTILEVPYDDVYLQDLINRATRFWKRFVFPNVAAKL